MNFNSETLRGLRPLAGTGRQLYIETYGCQMNANDSEVVLSILQQEGYRYTEQLAQADVILVNTCSVRDNAEQRVLGRIHEFKPHKQRKPALLIGIIGCMAERLKEELVAREPLVDLVAGPDAYRDLPRLLQEASAGDRAVNVLLSREETYAEIAPVRLDKNGVSGFISIMRGCNNMCAYCVVPYTRGTERSRDPQSILAESQSLFEAGYREVTLLGQNVNSYRWHAAASEVDFPTLLARVAEISPLLRVRFSTSHPKDLNDEVLHTMARYPNLCRAIHLPAQSGSTRMLELMNRKYTREWYLNRIAAIRRILPDCALSTDLITGFCTETPEDHQQTLSLMREVGYEFAFMFKYSERPHTKAARHFADDVPERVKTERLSEIINLQNELSLQSNRRDVGRKFEVLIEGVSKRREDQLFGRTSQNKVVVFDRNDHHAGEYVTVEITDCSSATLMGQVIGS
ncbi:MAG: tRNA (N6-isopentenyl adenosine(37)-C2)-methylthiotransferase MiaB [Alistipes sp.]|nr:tRNA (N6-isopentenyl adenosine(37)-C2)-methylthiotransferase MiaB [Alistipes sp.]